MAEKCEAIAKSGCRCTAAVLPGARWCLFHSPDAAALRLEGARKGGRNRATEQRAKKLVPLAMTGDELAGYLSALFKATVSGKVEPKVATASATVARALLEVRQQVEVEERLGALEVAAGIEPRRSA